MTQQPIQTTAYWDQAADGYIAGAEPFTGLFCRDAVALADILPGMTLLDIATGPGALAVAAAEAGARVTAIDFSQTMIERVTACSDGLEIEARRMDGQALGLPSDHFDRVASVFGIPLFPDWRAGLSEAARVLRPGGRAVIGVADNPYGFGPNQLFAQARLALFPGETIDMGIAGMTVLDDADRLVAALQDAGFEAIDLHSRTHEILIDAALLSPDNLMVASNPLIAKQSEAVRRAIVDVARELAERWRDGDVIRMPGTARLAVATKAG